MNEGIINTAVLVSGGPSLEEVCQDDLDRTGAITMAVNEHAFTHGLYCQQAVLCDRMPIQPDAALDVIERGDVQCHLRWCTRDETVHGTPVKDLSNVNLFWSIPNLPPEEYFTNDRYYWGTTTRIHGNKSVVSSLYPSFRLLYEQGVRRIHLLAFDFHAETMRQEFRFGRMNAKLRELRPVFEDADLTVVNSTRDSDLDAFDFEPLPKGEPVCAWWQ